MKVYILEGSDPHNPLFLSCDLPADGPHPVGNGFHCHLITIPSGRTFVAESTSGAIISDSLESVRREVSTGDTGDFTQQIRDGIRWAALAKPISQDEFHAMLDQLPANT